MAIERKWNTVTPKSFTQNGDAYGLINLADTAGFKVKQIAYLQSNTQPKLQVQVKKVLSRTQLIVGTVNNAQIGQWPNLNISAYTLADGAAIGAPEQDKNNIKPDDIEVATYESDPTVARRNVLVDKYGVIIDSRVDNEGINRLAVDGQFHAEVDVQVDVDIDGVYDPTTNPDPDNIGLIAHTRSNPTDETKQIERVTAKRGTLDTDTVSQDVSLHDHNGNKYNLDNPLPVIGSFEKFFAIIAPSKWMELATYDEVIPTFLGNELTLTYKEDGALLGTAVVTDYTSLTGWSLKLNRYIDDDDGSILLDDDDEPLNLD